MGYPPRRRPASIRWSASSLRQLLRGCSAEFYFQRIRALEPDRVSATLKLGSAVHAAHERARVAQVEGHAVALSDLLESFDASWEESCRDERLHFPKGKDAASLSKRGRALVELLAKNLGEERVLAAELPFEVEILLPNGKRRILTGFFDAVTVDGEGHVTVRELKTSATAYNEFKLEDDIQAVTYSLAAKKLFGHDTRLVYDVLIKTKVPRFQTLEVWKDETDFARLARLILVAESLLDAGVMYPNPDWRCGGCGFRSACADWGRRSLPLAC